MNASRVGRTRSHAWGDRVRPARRLWSWSQEAPTSLSGGYVTITINNIINDCFMMGEYEFIEVISNIHDTCESEARENEQTKCGRNY